MLMWAQSIHIPIVDEYYFVDKLRYMKYTFMPSHMSNDFFFIWICVSQIILHALTLRFWHLNL